MIISGVDIDPRILDALEEDNLVVFAGAGVSMGPPCNLDNFVSLTKKIGEGTDLEFTDKDKEYPEVYLGKLKSKGVKIYERLHDKLLNVDSSYTSLHQDLIKLFNTPERCRIITTNYDLFFETAFTDIYDEIPRNYISTALPLGRDFTGIVHIHGALDADRNGIVLTDDDFGRAYLTEGWARRFLRDVFENNTVLFIGYSHDDTVMKYLARGLPPSDNNKRYVFTGEYDKRDKWEHLEIEAIIYPQKNETDFNSLNQSIEKFASLNAKGALELEKRISEIVSSPSTLDEESESELQWYLSKEYTTRFFCKHAEDKEWLKWVRNNGFLDFIFQKGELDERQKHLASWFSKFVVKDYQRVLEIFTSQHQKPNYQVIRSIASDLIFSEEQVLDKEIYSAWFPVLEPFLFDWYDLVHPKLFENIESIGADEILLLLVKSLTKPVAQISPYFSYGFNDEEERLVDYDIKFKIDHYKINEAADKQIKPKMSDYAYDLFEGMVSNLNQAYQLNKAWGKSNEKYDSLSNSRSAIEPHEQDKYPDVIDVIIDLARDALEFLTENDPQYAEIKIKSLFKNESKLIQRIGIDGLCKLYKLSANEKVDWITKNNWLSDIRLKHEGYRLISIVFPKLSDKEKDEALDHFFIDIANIFEDSEDDDLEKDIAYQKFNLLMWLQKYDNSNPVKNRLKVITDKYPEFKPREHLDLTSWVSSGVYESGSGVIEKDLLLSKSAEEALKLILKELPSREYDKAGKLNGLTEACKENVDWGKKFAKVLKNNKVKDSYVISAILNAWATDGLKTLLRDDYFDFISDEIIQKNSIRTLSQHLQSLSEKENLNLNQDDLNKFEQLINSLWKFTSEIDVGLENSSWLERAINHPAGKLTLTWIKIISYDFSLNDGGSDLSNRILKERFEKIINEETDDANFSKAILGSQFDYFLNINSDWAIQTLLPLFDFNKNESAEVLWDGWLSWGRLTQRNLEELLPHYKRAIEYLAQENQKKSLRFASHISNLILFVLEDPISEIINPYVAKASEQSRNDLINQINNRIKNLVPDKKEYHWNKWLKDYIYQRIQSVPKPLTSGEYEGILNWIINLEPVFEEAVALFVQSDPLSFKYSSVFHYVLDSDLVKTNPNQIMELTLHVLEANLENNFCYYLRKIYEKLDGIGKSEILYENLGNRLAEVGCI